MSEQNERYQPGGGHGPGNLPAVPDGAGVEEMVFDGEVVGDPAPEPARPTVVVLKPAVQVFQTINVVVRHERTRAAGRHAKYVAAGLVVFARRRRRARTLALDFASQAKAQGDHANGLLWAQQHEAALKARHERREKRARLAIDLLKASPLILAAVAVLMLLLGAALARAHRDWADVILPFTAAADAAADLWAILPAILWALCIAGTSALLAVLHELGRRGGDLAPGWSAAAKGAEEERGLVVTADGIVAALQHLPISELKKAVAGGWRPSFHTLPIRDGEGYFAVFSTPMGITPEMIADQNKVFARNLHRAAHEVWPTDAERDKIAPAGYVAVWVANPGVLDRPAPEWPLLHEGTADVFKGVPAGVSPRGEAITVPVVGNNFAIGGMMGQGKSNACRVVMLGAALDPLAELLVHVFAYNGDFDAYAPRLYRYVKGAEEEQVDAAMITLNELYKEVGEREQMLADIGAKKVTRQLALRYPELRPRMTLFSECHELFGHKDAGEEATELAVSVIRRARKTALWMGFDTQDSRKDAIPPKLVNLVSVNACFYVKGWQANDGFLGAGSFKAGIRATELRPGRDIGRSLVTGVSNAQFEILKWHYIFSDDDTGADDAAPVIARAMATLAPGTRAAAGSPVLPAITARDLLEDLAAVIDGPDRVRLADLPPRLRKLAPSHGPYRALDGVQLAGLLDAERVPWVRPKNVPQLDPAELRKALTERGELARAMPANRLQEPSRRPAPNPRRHLTRLTIRRSGRQLDRCGSGLET